MSMFQCGYNGRATVQRHQPDPSAEPTYDWLDADDCIHVATELVEDEFARGFLGSRYELGAWCYEADAYHATLQRET
jgi:hypothetical protein